MAIVIYAAKDKLTPQHQRVEYLVKRGPSEVETHYIYLRLEHVIVDDLEDGLDLAQPRKVNGVLVENVLNCISDEVLP